MIFRETSLDGVYAIEIDVQSDERGSFGRSFCAREFEAHGMNPRIAQCNVSHNRKRGTLRGMHYQDAPHAEDKLVRCARGAMYDVIVDIRPDSSSYGKWAAFELRTGPGRPSTLVYVPAGCAHGFLTLEDDTEVFYQMSEFYAPASTRGFRWNDPAFGIEWPGAVRTISDRDRTYPDFELRQTVVGR